MFSNPILHNIVTMGLWSAVFTTVAVMVFAALEKVSVWSPLNAIAHIFFGDEAIGVNRPVTKCLVSGTILNLGAALGWAAIAEFGYYFLKISAGHVFPTVALSAAVTVLAYITDFVIVPKRLTPGFEHVLSRRSLYLVYGVLALALTLGGLQRV
ncbi:MAG: hypothetical protein K8R88_02685 [Armatimonadetes bacterium]|nr:hypothetical protein [Armatimonadota bacterium]